MIHFTAARFSTSLAYIGSTNRSLAAGGALNSFDFTWDYDEPDGLECSLGRGLTTHQLPADLVA